MTMMNDDKKILTLVTALRTAKDKLRERAEAKKAAQEALDAATALHRQAMEVVHDLREKLAAIIEPENS